MSETGKLVVTGIACLALGAVAAQYLPLGNITGSTAGVDESKVKAIVASYIADNPDKLVESLQSLQQRAAVDQQQQMQKSVQDNLAALKDSTDAPTAGTGASGITIVEFFDYNCGYCKRMANTMKTVLEAHPDIKVVFREFPILSETSQLAAQASLAISYLKPAKYLEYHMMLMQHKGQYDIAALKDYAGQVQVDIAAFEKEMNGERVMKQIQNVNDLANTSNIQGTPAIIIGDELIPGAVPFAEVDKRIKALKAKKDS